MSDFDSRKGEPELVDKTADVSIRHARGVLVWSIAILNVAASYALIIWHDPWHLSGFAAFMLLTGFLEESMRLAFRLHVAVWRSIAFLTEQAAVLVSLGLLIRGAWTNELLYLKLAALVFFGLLALSGIIEGILIVLTYKPEPTAPVEDTFPRRFDVTIPTDDSAAAESNRLIEEEFRRAGAKR